MYVFEINNFGINSIKDKTKEFYKMLFGGIIFYFTLFCATRYTIDNEGYRIFLLIFLTVLYAFIFIFTPITLLIKLHKIIRKIQINESYILLETNRELWLSKNEIVMKEVRNKFTGFSMRNKDGILFKTLNGKEYWIVEDFFNNYEELKIALMKHYN